MAGQVYRAGDASLVVSAADAASPERAAAAGIVGSTRDVVFRVTSDVRPFYEIGRRYPKVTLFGVAFDSWHFVPERVSFQALRIAFEEA